MPNHCDADLTVTGPADVVGEFLARYVTKADGTLLNLDAIRPYPAKLKEMDRIAHEWDDAHPDGKPWRERPKDGFNSGGYDWCIENWGTKWGCYKTHGCSTPLEKIDDGVILHFSTAWSPFRLDLLQAVSQRLPALRFQYDYYEQGMGFQGHVTVTGGRILVDEEGTYDGERGG
jgi:Ferredoxin-like domain in Api92-like protein